MFNPNRNFRPIFLIPSIVGIGRGCPCGATEWPRSISLISSIAVNGRGFPIGEIHWKDLSGVIHKTLIRFERQLGIVYILKCLLNIGSFDIHKIFKHAFSKGHSFCNISLAPILYEVDHWICVSISLLVDVCHKIIILHITHYYFCMVIKEVHLQKKTQNS